MQYKKHLLLSFLITAILSTNLLNATEDTNLIKNKDWIVLPYLFSTDSTGFSGGIVVIKQRLLQPQTTLVASVFGGVPQDIIINGQPEEANFSGGFISFSDFKLPYSNRFFFSLIGLKSYFPRANYYINGSNDSNKDDVFTTSGDSNFFNTTFRYVLPIGEGLDNPEGLYRLQVGRVHDQYNFDLLSDIKYDVGVSLRAMVAQLPVRLDVAYSEEGTNMWVMVQQPFDF